VSARPGAHARLRLEPWAVTHGGSWQDEGPEGPDDAQTDTLSREAVGLELPVEEWRGLAPTAPAAVTEVWFLDGVRRVEARAMLEVADLQRHAAIGSCAVGAVVCAPDAGAPAAIGAGPITERWCVIAADAAHAADLPDLEVGAGETGAVLYRVATCPGDDHQAPTLELQRRMRAAEARLVSDLLERLPREGRSEPAGAPLLLCDGPRPYVGPDPRLVGYIKSVQQQRLPAPAFRVVRSLEAGERSPVYVVGSGPHARFEWYLRLRDPRPWLHSLAGSVRLQSHAGERPTELLATARALADWSAANLPRFATRAHQDPRAPQQLLPVRALEERLRRGLGSAQLLRRRLEVALATGGEA